MYRNNRFGCCSSRDRIDPRLLERIVQPNTQNGGCGCEVEENDTNCHHDDTVGEFNYSLASVYASVQEWQNLYCEEEGHVAGTIFKELDKPFYGPRCGGFCNE